MLWSSETPLGPEAASGPLGVEWGWGEPSYSILSGSFSREPSSLQLASPLALKRWGGWKLQKSRDQLLTLRLDPIRFLDPPFSHLQNGGHGATLPLLPKDEGISCM